MIGSGMTQINKKLERKYGVINMFRIDIVYVCNRLKDISMVKNQTKKDQLIKEFIDELIYNLGVDVLIDAENKERSKNVKRNS